MNPGIIAAICFGAVLFAAGAPVDASVGRGNRDYSRADYEEALKAYEQARINDPENPRIHYNIGSAQYQTGRFEDAVKSFEQSLSSAKIPLQARAYYNRGNALFRLGKWDEAIESYKKTLQLDPHDLDAKYNIEFIRRKIKELMDQNKDNIEERQKEAQKQTAQAHEKQQEEQDGDNADDDGKQERKAGELSEEDAKRILNALSDQDRKASEQRMMRPAPQMGTGTDKDW